MLPHLEQLISENITRTYKQGSMILYQGEVPRSVCIIKSGVVRVYSISSQGEDKMVTLHTKGEIFPSSWIFQKSSSALFFYEALTDCDVTFVPRSQFIDFMQGTPSNYAALLDYFTTNYAASLIRINALEQPKARDKLVHTLFYLSQRFGKKTTDNKIEITISLTHQNLASLVGITRETTAVELNILKKQKVLTYRMQHYTVHIERLMELMGEESFRGVLIAG